MFRLLAVGWFGLLALGASGLSWCSAAVAKSVASIAAPADKNASLAGHYYLSGIREVGSEILLGPDARFQWMLAYGSLDQSASGTWQLDGTTVILTVDRVDPKRPVAKAGPLVPWDIDAENAMRRKALERRQDAVAEKCPFIASVAAMTSAPTAALNDAERDADKAKAFKSIPKATQIERSTRMRAEAASAAAVSETGSRARVIADAASAMEAWATAQLDLSDLHSRAGLARPEQVRPRLPAECTMPDRVEADSNPAGWSPGRGIRLRFGDEDLSPGRIAVTFEFARGPSVTVASDRSGYAFMLADPARSWVSTSLVIPTENGLKSGTIVAPAQGKGIQIIIVDERALISMPFDTMRLKVSGRRLVPEGALARGTYSREP